MTPSECAEVGLLHAISKNLYWHQSHGPDSGGGFVPRVRSDAAYSLQVLLLVVSAQIEVPQLELAFIREVRIKRARPRTGHYRWVLDIVRPGKGRCPWDLAQSTHCLVSCYPLRGCLGGFAVS